MSPVVAEPKVFRGPTRPLAWISTVATVVAASSAAAAQDEKAVAEALFRDGRDLLAAGKTSEACAKFATSQRIEPKLGTLLNLAACHEAEGRTASAWAEFTEAAVIAARAKQPEREQFAREHAGKLGERLSRVRISVAGDQQVSIQIDGLVVDRTVLGSAIPLDPGAHQLVVTAQHKKPHEAKLVVPAGPSLTEVEVPMLASVETAPPAPRSSTNGPPPDAAPDRSRTYAWAAFGAGAAAVAAGTYFGLTAFAKNADADELGCRVEGDEGVCPDVGSKSAKDASRLPAHASTFAFGVAAVAVGVGIYFLVRSPSSSPTAARHAIDVAGRGVRVTW
jgi:hypothetical protein